LSVAPILIIALSLEIMLRKIPNDYAYKKKYLDAHADKIKTLFLGSSHAYYGVNPDYISENSFNASHISQSLDFDFKIINKYKNDWSQLTCIAIPVDYFTFFSRISNGQESWRVKNYNIYYDMNESFNLTENSELLSFDLPTNLKRIKEYYFDHQSKITCSRLGYGIDQRDNVDLIKTGYEAARRHTQNNLDNLNINYQSLNEIILFAKRNGIKVLLYTSPAYETYVSKLDSNQLSTNMNRIKALLHKNPNCFYYNFLEDKSFTPSDFRDADHLNEQGAIKLSLKINETINRIHAEVDHPALRD